MSFCCLGEPDTRTPYLINMSLVTARPVFYCIICKCRAEWNGTVQPKPVPHHFGLKTEGFGDPTRRHSGSLTSMTRSLNSGETGPVRAQLMSNLDAIFSKAIGGLNGTAVWSSSFKNRVVNEVVKEIRFPGTSTRWAMSEFPNHGFDTFPSFLRAPLDPAPRPSKKPVERLFLRANPDSGQFVPFTYDNQNLISVPHSFLREVYEVCVELEETRARYLSLQREFIEYKLENQITLKKKRRTRSSSSSRSSSKPR